MAKINKQEVMQKLIDELQLYPGKDLIPSELADKILAVYQINAGEVSVKTPTATIVRGQQQNSNGTTTIYTTPSTGKFYLTNVVASIGSIVVPGDYMTCHINCTIDGAAQTVLRVMLTKSALGSPTAALALQNPILLDPGTVISITNSTANSYSNCVIIGYTED